MATTQRKSRILEEVGETTRGLHDAGLVGKRRMKEFESLCHLDVHKMPPPRLNPGARGTGAGRFCPGQQQLRRAVR